jgi:hypothetical protein
VIVDVAHDERILDVGHDGAALPPEIAGVEKRIRREDVVGELPVSPG